MADMGISADYMQGTRVLYSTKEDAIRFAEKQGRLLYYLEKTHVFFGVFRLGLLCATPASEAYSPKELQASGRLPPAP